MLDCPIGSYPCADDEQFVVRNFTVMGKCCPGCPQCLSKESRLALDDCSTEALIEAETESESTEETEETTEAPTELPVANVDTFKDEPTESTKFSDFETTNMISVSTTPKKRDSSLERQTMNTLKSFGQRFLELFRRKSPVLKQETTLGVQVGLGHKLDDVGDQAQGEIRADNRPSSSEESTDSTEEDTEDTTSEPGSDIHLLRGGGGPNEPPPGIFQNLLKFISVNASR